LSQLVKAFQNKYKDNPRIFRAPGRVNLIGEHTDYNDGFVLPAAIDRDTRIAATLRHDRKLMIFSLTLDSGLEFNIDEDAPRPRGDWSDYVRGVAHILAMEGYRLNGANLMIETDIPIGAGLSSSAAIEVATGLALTSLAEIEIQPLELARICQRAENEFVGMRCGIMDQLIACLGQPGAALLIDCRNMTTKSVSVDETKARIVLCNTMVKHKLAGSEYNVRRAECETGAGILSKFIPGVRNLRDVSPAKFKEYEHELPSNIRKRCRHVISENDRVLTAARLLEDGDLQGFGRLMTQSHRSLRDDYQVSCLELDQMVDLAEGLEGVFGARMTGGGFGGCTFNLAKPEAAEFFCHEIKQAYFEASGVLPEIYICRTAEGAGEFEVTS